MCKQLPMWLRMHNLHKWPSNIRESFTRSCKVVPSFISEPEEVQLLKEVEPHLKRLRYEKSHWDDAIHLYREREQTKWTPMSEAVIQRVREFSFPPDALHLSRVHILDLAAEGVIKPHVDSVRYCGRVISGLSLLSNCVMRLRHTQHTDVVADLWLERRSLYKLADESRFDYTHEILADEESIFDGKPIKRERRISVICRDLPKVNEAPQELEFKSFET